MSNAAYPFPSFWPAFRSRSYILLLGPYPRNERAYWVVESCLEQGGAEAAFEIIQMLGHINWRVQIVGIVAAIITHPSRETIDAVWRALDHGSWVSPQLAAVARQVDPSFFQSALERLRAHGEVAFDLHEFASEERDLRERLMANKSWRGKKLSSLAVLAADLDAHGELAEIVGSPQVQEVLAADGDGGARIAKQWYAGALELVEVIRQRPLTPS